MIYKISAYGTVWTMAKPGKGKAGGIQNLSIAVDEKNRPKNFSGTVSIHAA